MSNANVPSLIHELENSTVGIKIDDKIKGTGIIVSEDGLILTCYHVVGDRDSKKLFSDNIKVILSGPEPSLEKAVKFEPDKSNAALDIAFLKLAEKFDNAGVARLDKSRDSLDHIFYAEGFRKPQLSKSGLSAKGEIRGLVRSQDNVLRLQIHCTEIEGGMSGSAVLDIVTGRVVGMISSHYNRPDEPTLNFAIPVESIVESFSKIEEKNPGLKPVNRFLWAIGEVETSIYKWIDEVYVPPNEYDEIKESLKDKRIVFITGTKEFGKTFTAVKLMYEFFKIESYQPRWIKERKDQRGPEGADPQELARIMYEEGYIKPHQIFYFEDPFGKTKYESYNELESYVGGIIDNIRKVQDAYVIITSREEVFKQFRNEQDSGVDLENFEKKMNLKRASYSIEKKKEMLRRWAKVYNCKWLLDFPLTDHVLDNMEYQQELLPTPMNIKEFALASCETVDITELEQLMKQKSKETAQRFGDEIMKMEVEKVLFLAFPYLGRIDVDLAREVYDSVTPSLKQQEQYPMDFKEVMEWFEGDKINISEHKIEFSHPSYEESFEYAIYGKTSDNRKVRDIFSQVLLKLADRDEALEYVGHRIMRNVDRLPKQVIEELLFKLADKKDSRALENVASIVRDNFNKLPKQVIEKLLLKLADNDSAAGNVASTIIDNFDNLPSEVQHLLFKLADNDSAAGNVASTIIGNFDKLPPNIREQLILKLADNDEAASYVAEGITNSFDKLPPNIREQLILKLADNVKAARNTALLIRRNFNILPPNIREQLILKLADNDEAAGYVASTIIDNFDKLPPNIREQLILKLADNDEAARFVANAITDYFNILPPNIREQLILKLADNDEAASHIARAIIDNFDKLPPNIREQLLVKLADNDRAVKFVASTIIDNFDKLPPNIREQLLLVLADNDRAAANVAYAIKQYFNILPPNIREQLILKLADNDEAAGYVASTIIDNFDKLPPNIREQLILKLADNDEAASHIARAIIGNFDKLPPNIREQLILKLADNDEAASYVAEGITNSFDKLPPNIREQLILKLADNVKAARNTALLIRRNFNILPPNIREQLILKLADNDEAASHIARAIIDNFDKLPPHFKQLLFTLVDKEGVLPSLVDKEGVLGSPAGILSRIFYNMPKEPREEFLLRLADKPSATAVVSDLVEYYESNLSEQMRKEILDKIKERGIR